MSEEQGELDLAKITNDINEILNKQYRVYDIGGNVFVIPEDKNYEIDLPYSVININSIFSITFEWNTTKRGKEFGSVSSGLIILRLSDIVEHYKHWEDYEIDNDCEVTRIHIDFNNSTLERYSPIAEYEIIYNNHTIEVLAHIVNILATNKIVPHVLGVVENNG